MSDHDHPPKLEISSDSPPIEVPTFGCVVYVSKVDGGVKARVANLANLECTGGSERDALSKLVPAFKKAVTEFLTEKQDIPWIDPPSPKLDDEQKRFIPVHL